MTNLNQLQSELAALTERVNSAMSITEGSFTFTRDELKQLINKVQEQTKEWIENEVDDMRFDEDDFIDLDLNGREIDLNFNEDQLRRDKRSFQIPNFTKSFNKCLFTITNSPLNTLRE